MKYAIAWACVSDIEGLVGANSRTRAAGHVADDVAARLACGDAHGRQPPHQVRGVIDVDEVALEVLTCRHVQHANGVFLGYVRQGYQLVGAHPPHRDLDALHLDPILALPVDAVAQAEFREDLLVDQAGLNPSELGLEDVDLLPDGCGQMPPFGTAVHRRKVNFGHAANLPNGGRASAAADPASNSAGQPAA